MLDLNICKLNKIHANITNIAMADALQSLEIVAVGGCYRLIDILMSNCINSSINKIFVLTQFNSASLNRHIARTDFGNGVNFGDGFVEVLAATQTPGEAEARMNWFQGTADAVRQFTWVFEVPVGGCYRLIDILMSNCINSSINKIFVLTQFNSASLNRHFARTDFGNGVNFGDGFVEVLAATQTPGEAEARMNWFQGTADAVRQFTWVFEHPSAATVYKIDHMHPTLDKLQKRYLNQR